MLFTGTPCQVAGLYAYLAGKRHEGQLITIDLVCHGIPSQGAFDAYLKKSIGFTTGISKTLDFANWIAGR